jgi:hypothetical protein
VMADEDLFSPIKLACRDSVQKVRRSNHQLFSVPAQCSLSTSSCIQPTAQIQSSVAFDLAPQEVKIVSQVLPIEGRQFIDRKGESHPRRRL